jgi:hypothetical protein
MADPEISREDVASAVGARRELGRELEPEVVDAFLERVERGIDARVDRRLAERGGSVLAGMEDRGTSMTLAIVSLGTGIPITAIAGGIAGLPGIIAAWLGIVGVNALHNGWKP